MTEPLLRLEYKPSVPPALLMRLEKTYNSYTSLVAQTERALNAAWGHPELKELVDKLRSTDRQLKELLIGQVEKGAPVNIGGEDTRLVDALNDGDSSTAMVRRVTAKKLAKRLYALHHPDKGGSVSVFNTIRSAANSGDLEALYFFRIRDHIDTFDVKTVKTLEETFNVKMAKFRGKSSWKVASLFHSGSELFVPEFRKVLEAKIYDLNMQMYGYTVTQSNSPENQ